MNHTRRKISPVLDIAHGLGMPASADPVAYLITYCRRLVDRWVRDYGPRSLGELLSTAAAKIGVIIEEVHQDWDLQEISQRYLAQREGSFARIASELDQRTFALAIRLRRPRNGCSHVAVIDCRGSKHARRWFSILHEIVHLMLNPQLELDFRRTTAESKDPVEAMIDKIAGELAFIGRCMTRRYCRAAIRRYRTLRSTANCCHRKQAGRLPTPPLCLGLHTRRFFSWQAWR